MFVYRVGCRIYYFSLFLSTSSCTFSVPSLMISTPSLTSSAVILPSALAFLYQVNKGITIYLDKDTEYKCKSAKLEILNNRNEAYITISEGKFHQVKKMCSAVDKKVLELKRVGIGKLKLDPMLNEGEYRALNHDEVEMFI